MARPPSWSPWGCSRESGMTLCHSTSAFKSTPYGGVAVSLPCRAWTCEHCAPKRRKALIAMAANGHPTTFITLTINPQMGSDPVHRAEMLARAWRIVVKRIKRKLHLDHLPYMVFVESTKKGEPHLHILARAPYIDQRWLSAQMRDVIASPICDIRKIDNTGRAIGYVTKYVGKAPAQFGTTKRYWRTQDYLLTWQEAHPPAIEAGWPWTFQPTTVEWIAASWEAMGREVTWDCPHTIHWGQPP